MKKLLGILGLVLLLTGCGSAKERTMVCKIEKDGDNLEETFEAKGDEVIKDTVVRTIDFNAQSGEIEMSDEEILKLANEDPNFGGLMEKYNGINGMEGKITVKDGIVEVRVVIDYTKADLKELQKQQIIQGGDNEEADFVSYEKTVEVVKKTGATCTEK